MASDMRNMRFGQAEQRNQYAVSGILGTLDFTRVKLARVDGRHREKCI